MTEKSQVCPPDIKISVAIITFNEESHIRRTLESVRPFADQVLVVDSHSQDDTVAISRQMGAEVMERAFEGYIEQKNFALDQCRYNYVFSLDGDEVVGPELCQSILSVKSQWDGSGYSLNRCTHYVDQWIRHCGWYPDKKIRLVDRRYARWSGVNPHDTLQLNEDAGPIHLNGDLLHYSYSSISDHVRQTNQFTTISARAHFQKGIRSNLFKIITRPILKFLRDYFWKRGFLDGYYGFVICSINSLSSFLKYVKIYELQRKKPL